MKRMSYILACQKDSYLKKLKDVEVLNVLKNNSGNVLVQLQDTVLFPEGGGQPADFGAFKTASTTYPVKYVQRNEDGTVWHTLDISEDTKFGESKIETVEVDWERRFDHMQQHSGQHLLSAIAMKHYKLNTVSWSLTKTGNLCYVDLEAGAPLSEKTLDSIESLVNQKIVEDCKFTPSVLSYEEIEASGATTRSDKLSSEFPIRMMEIENLDKNLCCGTHIRSSRELQLCKLFHNEVVKRDKKKKVVINRVYFLFGLRLIDFLSESYSRTRQLSKLLSSQPSDHVERVSSLMKESKQQQKQMKQAMKDLAIMIAKELISERQVEDESPLIVHNRTATPDFVSALYAHLADFVKEGKLSNNATIFVISGDEKAKSGGMFVLHCAEEKMQEIKQKVLECLHAKGGGKGSKVQGKFPPGALTKVTLEELKRLIA